MDMFQRLPSLHRNGRYLKGYMELERLQELFTETASFGSVNYKETALVHTLPELFTEAA